MVGFSYCVTHFGQKIAHSIIFKLSMLILTCLCRKKHLKFFGKKMEIFPRSRKNFHGTTLSDTLWHADGCHIRHASHIWDVRYCPAEKEVGCIFWGHLEFLGVFPGITMSGRHPGRPATPLTMSGNWPAAHNLVLPRYGILNL